MIYLDSSALVKLVLPEAGSAALKRWLNSQPDAVRVSSVLADVEVTRAVRRAAPNLLALAAEVVDALAFVELHPSVQAIAGAYASPVLRSADAIHLASAELLQRDTSQRIEAFVAYDRQLSAAATGAGLNVVAPV